MKVAICYTKRRTDEIMESFTKGVVSSGDHVELVKSKSDLHKLERCDVSFQIAEVTRYESLCYHSDPHGMAEEGYMRVAIKNKMIELGRQRVMLDCGILDDDRNRDPSERYYSIGVDGIKRGANFYNENSPNDRFKKRELRIKEWRNSGDHVLIIGQTHYGAGLSHVGTESDPMSNMWTDPTDYDHNQV